MKPVVTLNHAASWVTAVLCSFAINAWAGSTPIMVNSLVDPGTGGCDASQCTLREALALAGTDGVPSIIEFAPELTGTITLTDQLVVPADTEILGPGPDVITVSGNNAHRVFFISNNANNVTLSGLTIANGNTTSIASPGNSSGAGIFVSTNQVLLSNLRVVNNVSPIFSGGVSASGSSLVIMNSEISGNEASAPGGMSWTGFGDTLLMENVTIQGNTANQAASGLWLTMNTGDQVTLRHITVAENLGPNNTGMRIGGSNGSAVIIGSVFSDHGGNPATDVAITNSNVMVIGSVIEETISTINGSNNLIGVDAGLGTFDFQPAGATTRVFDLLSVSPAIDLIANGQFGCGTDVTLDQVGQPRPQIEGCDAGAWEAANAGPVAVADMANVVPNFPITVNVAANDFEPGGSVLPASVSVASPPAHGVVSNLGDGTLTYTPDPGFGGPIDSFTYTIMDDDGETSLPGTVTLLFVPVADPAVTLSGPVFVPFGDTVEYPITVRNLGQAAINAVSVQSMFDPRFTTLNWSCSGQDGAICPTTNGVGNLNETVDLPMGGTLSYTVQAVTGSTTDESDLNVTVMVAPTNSALELTVANNSDVVTASVGIFRDGLED